jgi:hypothetical protein
MRAGHTTEDKAIFDNASEVVQRAGQITQGRRDFDRMRGFEVARSKGFTPRETLTEVEWQQYV